MDTVIIYHSLSSKIVSSLLEQLLFVGIFSIAFVIVRRSILEPSWLKSNDFIRQMMLLFSIALFTSYIFITYEVENIKGLSFLGAITEVSDKEALLGDLSQNALAKAKTQLLLLLPVDLIGIALISGMFASLIVFNFDSDKLSGRNASTIKEVLVLFSITIVWHIAMIVWWVLYGLFENSINGVIKYIPDIMFHITYIVVEGIIALTVARFYPTKLGSTYSSILAWGITISYCLILVSLYAVRLWQYMDRFVSMISIK